MVTVMVAMMGVMVAMVMVVVRPGLGLLLGLGQVGGVWGG